METTVAKNVLKGGEFLIKEGNPMDVFIPEEMNEEQGMVRQMIQDYVKESGAKGGKIEYQVELLEKAGELGLLGSHIPEGYGGMPMDTNTNTLICEEMGHLGGGFTTTYAAHTGIGMLPILYFGTEEQKLKYLPGLASGALKAAYCLTEPGSGSDALAAKTRADLNEAGTHYILNGQKMWISNAGFADVFVVFAKIDGTAFTGFIVEANTEGVSLGAEEDKMGIKGSSTRQVFFENAAIPKENMLGEFGKGHLIAFNILNVGRFKLGALACGGGKNAASISTRYANERVQFKVPISSFGAIQYKLAEMAVKIFALESTVYRVSDLLQDSRQKLLASGKSYSDALLESAEEYAIECALIKVLGSEVADFVVDEMVQIHGGNGFSEEYPAAQAYRDARINRIYEGTNEINRMLMVSMLLKSAMKGKLDIVGPAWAVQKELASAPSTETPDGVFGQEFKAVKDFKKVILLVAGAAAKMQMEGQLNLKEEQEILMNVADMMIDAYNSESALLRAAKMKAIGKADDAEVLEALVKVSINDTNAKVRKNAQDALAAFVEGDMLTTLMSGVERFTKYPPVNVKAARRTIADRMIKANGYCF